MRKASGGASRPVFGSERFPVRGAYCLVRQTNCGEGNGAEHVAGVADLSNACIDVTFGLVGGVLGIAGVTPSDARDLVYGPHAIHLPRRQAIRRSNVGYEKHSLFPDAASA